jgi:CRP-like cAMP-binding protein
MNGSYTAGFAVLLAGLAIALSLRQVISLWVLRSFGARPWKMGLGVTFLIPHFYLDERDVAIAGRKGRMTLAAFRLAVPAVLLGAANLLMAREANQAVYLLHDSWALALLVASCPFLPVSDFRRLMTALMPAEHIWERSRSYLFERLIKQAATFKETFRRDPVTIVSALAYPVWCYAALLSVGALLRDNTLPLVLDLLSSGEEPALQIGIGLLLAFIAFTAGLLIAIPVYGLLQAATHFVPGWHRQVSNQKRHHVLSGGDTWKELGQVALFAHLEESALKELAEKLQLEVFHAADRIFSQNDAGDRFYSIRQGQVEILRKDETGFNKSLAVLGPGQSFGEIALLEGGARTATVRAISHVECFSLHRDAFKEFIAKLGLQGAEITEFLRLSQFLRGIKLFQNLGPAETVRILQRAQRRMVSAGTRIISEGDEGNEFFLIRQGQYSVTVHGNEVARLKTGEYFGEIALLMNTKRTAKVTALTDGELLVMTRQHFYDTVASNFQLGLGLEGVTRIRRAKSQEIHANV